jgi:CelD/BcsL family acetyltransferase involved in cellulose biosynthesis
VPDTAVEFSEYRQLDALPPEALALFDQESPFSTLAWYRAVTAHALPPDAVPAFLVARLNGRILAVFPMQRGPGNTLGSLAPPYTSLWQPLICEAAAHDPESLLLIGRSFASICRRLATVRLEAMDASSLDLPKLMAGLRAGGILPLRFDNFGNWHQPLEQGWAGYLAARPSALYETIRRRTKRLAGDPGVCFSLVEGVANLDQAIADYGAIYAASWKQPEPFENFIAGYVREAATENTLRLFLLHLNATPIAAQIWIVQAGVGHLLKLAHLESHRALSPGTVLTAHAIQQLMQRDNIAHLDFGRGDDAYKSLWASERRQRIGLLLANPSTILGISKIARHVAGSLRRRVLQLRSP